MQTITESAARALLASRHRCEDVGRWDAQRAQPDAFIISGGVVDEDGIGAKMLIKLAYKVGRKTNIRRYLFTIFRREVYGLVRIYQLEVTQSVQPIKDLHKRSHEHMGDSRTIGDASWDKWSYDDVLARFCQMTNLSFVPPPSHPEQFELRGN